HVRQTQGWRELRRGAGVRFPLPACHHRDGDSIRIDHTVETFDKHLRDPCQRARGDKSFAVDKGADLVNHRVWHNTFANYGMSSVGPNEQVSSSRGSICKKRLDLAIIQLFEPFKRFVEMYNAFEASQEDLAKREPVYSKGRIIEYRRNRLGKLWVQ